MAYTNDCKTCSNFYFESYYTNKPYIPTILDDFGPIVVENEPPNFFLKNFFSFTPQYFLLQSYNSLIPTILA